MTRGTLRLASAALLALTVAGCTSVVVTTNLHGQELTPGAKPIAHIYADNWGIYLFYYIPLVTGDPSRPNGWRLFEDTVHIGPVVSMVARKAKELGATRTTDLSTYTVSYQSIPLLIWAKTVEVSGNASRVAPEGSASRPAAP